MVVGLHDIGIYVYCKDERYRKFHQIHAWWNGICTWAQCDINAKTICCVALGVGDGKDSQVYDFLTFDISR